MDRAVDSMQDQFPVVSTRIDAANIQMLHAVQDLTAIFDLLLCFHSEALPARASAFPGKSPLRLESATCASFSACSQTRMSHR